MEEWLWGVGIWGKERAFAVKGMASQEQQLAVSFITTKVYRHEYRLQSAPHQPFHTELI